MSMPVAHWDYDWNPEPVAPKNAFMKDFLPHRDWV